MWTNLRTPFGSQPWKALYIAYQLSSLLLRLPWWTALHLSGQSHLPTSYSLWEALNLRLIRMVVSTLPTIGHHMDVLGRSVTPEKLNARANETRAQWIARPTDHQKWFKGIALKAGCEPIDLIGVVREKGGKPEGELVVGKGENVFLNFHGGGLAFGNGTEKDVTADFARQVITNARTISHVLTPDYRKVNSGPFPMQLVDAITAYAYLIDVLHVSPSQILVGGDSAGGHLALCLVRYLRDELEAELPRAMLLSSPLVDVSYWLGPRMELNPSQNQELDVLDITRLGPWIAPLLLRDHPISVLESPYLSPAASVVSPTANLFSNFPPAYVLAGENEWYLSDVREFVRRLAISEVPCVYHEEPEAPHDFILFPWWNREKAGRASEAMVRWIDTQFDS